MILALQDVLGDVPNEKAELKSRSLETLATQLAELRRRIRDRQA